MNKSWEELKPLVNKPVLTILAGTVWVGAGIILNWMAITWYKDYDYSLKALIILLGLAVAIVKTRLIFNRMVRQNLERIRSLKDQGFIF